MCPALVQVHRGRLLESFVKATFAGHSSRFNSGTESQFAGVDVAIKVLHPRVEVESWIDCEVIFWCVHVFSRISHSKCASVCVCVCVCVYVCVCRVCVVCVYVCVCV
jgi:predicted unusual protein kinase regulating ubiquinone biosynthesis (AarF/ABC1/UbiB family)